MGLAAATIRRERQFLEHLETRQLLSAGAGVDVALIDNTLPNFQALLAAANAGGNRSKVVAYYGRSDSAAKVLGKLVAWAGATGNKIRSLSILSHGSGGRFGLGNEFISTRNENDKAWQRLRNVMDERARIYLFGCNVAQAGSDGQTLLNHLATASGASVFGSTDLTGGKKATGCWRPRAAARR
jgi:hypothetical protein